MARVTPALVVMALAMTIFSATSLFAASTEEVFGQVLFLENGQHGYLRGNTLPGNPEEVFTVKDIVASIAVLMGVPPPFMTSSADSAKIDAVVSASPFNRPGSVAALTIRGLDSGHLNAEEMKEILGSSIRQQRLLSESGGEGSFVLSGDVTIEQLNKKWLDQEQIEQGLEALFGFLGGSYLKEKDSDVIVVTVPLATTVSISLDLSKKADREFARDLVSLSHFMERAATVYGTGRTAELFQDTFSGIELMEEQKSEAAKIFLFSAVKVLTAVEASYDGQIVGVIVLSPISSIDISRQDVLQVKYPIRSRSLDESLVGAPATAPSGDLTTSNTLIEAEILTLVRSSLVVATAIILIIATLMGTCYLVYMPLTRDTLLYSGVKLD